MVRNPIEHRELHHLELEAKTFSNCPFLPRGTPNEAWNESARSSMSRNLYQRERSRRGMKV
jgi:hypothetical protein